MRESSHKVRSSDPGSVYVKSSSYDTMADSVARPEKKKTGWFSKKSRSSGTSSMIKSKPSEDIHLDYDWAEASTFGEQNGVDTLLDFWNPLESMSKRDATS